MADIRVLLDRLFAKRDGGNAEQQVLDVRPLNSDGTVIAATSPIGAVVATGNVANAVADSGNPVKVGGTYVNNLPTTLTSGQRGDVQIDSKGNLRSLMCGYPATGGDAISNVNIAWITNSTLSAGAAVYMLPISGFKFNGTSWDRDRKPNVIGKLVSSAATTNATLLKSSPGDLFRAAGYSNRATTCYLHLYNKATAPTVGTDVPVITRVIPPTSAFDFEFEDLYFATGIGYGFSTGVADNDAVAIAAGDITGFMALAA